AEPVAYPNWWQQYPRVVPLNAVRGVGAQWEMHIQFTPGVPYRLRFRLEMVRCEEPYGLEWRAQGDLDGRLEFRLEKTPTGTAVPYDSDLRTGKRLLNSVAPLTRGMFLRNHALMMRRADGDIRAELARRVRHVSA